MQEEWKSIEKNPRYEVSSLGRVRNGSTKQILRGVVLRTGYRGVTLTFEKSKQHTFNVHRLVALAFIPNPKGKREVNHIDGDKLNNKVENLEWVTPKENSLHAHRVLNCNAPACEKHPIRCVETGKVYPSVIVAAEETGLSRSCIGAVARGGIAHHTAGGMHWEYLDTPPREYVKKPKAMPQHIIKIVECVETGEKFLGTHQAAKAFGVCQTNIAAACRGKQHTCAGKHWRYAGEAPWGSKELPKL